MVWFHSSFSSFSSLILSYNIQSGIRQTNMLYTIFSLLTLLSLGYSTRVTYADRKVLRCYANSKEQLEYLHNIQDDNSLSLDFWLETRNIHSPIDIMVPMNTYPLLNEMLKTNDIHCYTMIENVQSIIDRELLQRNIKTESFFESYHNWTEVHEYFDGLAAEFPSMAAMSTIGNTYEGRPIKIMTISTKPGSGKPALWYDGGLHAREWVTVSTVTYLADTLLRGYGSNSDATNLLDKFDIIICPILNVDGYEYTWTTDRMWRKTRSPNKNSACMGTDPNRNWAYHWGEAGASPVACSDSYQGSSPASEIEVQNVQNYLYSIRTTLKSYVNFHSYSQLWMSNWGYTYQLPPDYPTQNELSEAAVAAIKSVHGKVYDYGPIAETIYPASGSSADYTYGVCGVVFSYGVELRDTGEFGFLLPPQEIIPQGEEIFAAVVAMGQYIGENSL